MHAAVNEKRPEPLWETFALLRDQVERLVALNLFWAVQLIPGVVGLAFPSLPLLLRTLLVGSSAFLIVPASLTVFTVIAEALDGSEITFADIRRAFCRGARSSFQTLAPLYLLLALLLWVNLSLPGPLLLLVWLRLALFVTLTCAMYWGPLAAEQPRRSAVAVFRDSLRLLLRFPGRTLGAALVSLCMLMVAAVSIGGMLLIVFVLLASYQTLLVHNLSEPGRRSHGTTCG